MGMCCLAVGALLALATPVVASTVANDTTVLVTYADLQDPGPAGGASPATGWVKAIGGGLTIGNTPYIEYWPGPGLPPAGLQSLHLQTGYDDANPLEKTYVGTNNFSGIKLADITEFSYCTFLASRDYPDHQFFCGQPPQIELCTDSGSTTQGRIFIYKPWGYHGTVNVGTMLWQEWNLMGDNGYWELLKTSSTNEHGNWSWLLGRYAGLKLQAPAVGDFAQGLNQSGTSLSIKLGSGEAFFGNNGAPEGGYQKAWWPESCGVNAWVDKLVIAYKERDALGNLTGNNIRITYDFDAPTQSEVVVNNRGATSDAALAAAEKGRWFVVYGKVLASPYGTDFFTIDDGSGTPIRVNAVGHTIPTPTEWDNFYVRVKGRMVQEANPPQIWSRADLIVQYFQ